MKFNLNLEEIKYAKILCKDISETPFIIKGAIKNINDREIILCAKFEDIPIIQTPQEISLSIVYPDGLYRTKTNLKSISKDEPYIFAALEIPHELEYQQNREYFRIPCRCKAQYYVKSADKFVDFETQTYDISANGVSIIIPMLIVSEEDSRLIIWFDNKKLETRVQYIRSEKVENGYKISFAFIKMSESDKDFISQVCIKKQLEQRRNSLY